MKPASSPRGRPRRKRALVLFFGLGATLFGCAGCEEDDTPMTIADGGADADGSLDAPSESETAALPSSIDFAVLGCPIFDGTIPRCSGPAPLTVSFAPITSGNVTRFLWDFGDQTTSSEPLPTHTYALPDSYDVTLLGAPGLFSSLPRPGFIQVTANPLGGACDISPQCEAPLSCVCGEAAQCPAAFARGICATSCAQSACPTGAVCADLGRGLSAAEAQPWRGPMCLRPCTADSECARGQRCRNLPLTTPAPGSWGRACFFDYPGDPGGACRGPSGEVQDTVCLGGRCADLGARGICSVDCSSSSCPDGTACARFTDGRNLCLRACDPNRPCGTDPLLSCVASGGTGPLAFTVATVTPMQGDAGVPAAAATTFCSAKRCTTDLTCLPAGVCKGAPAGHCVPRPQP